MSPLGGSGANMAIMDGVELVELLIKNSKNGGGGKLLATTIGEFDLHHTQRSVSAIKFSHRNIAIAESVGLKYQLSKFIMTLVAFVKNTLYYFDQTQDIFYVLLSGFLLSLQTDRQLLQDTGGCS